MIMACSPLLVGWREYHSVPVQYYLVMINLMCRRRLTMRKLIISNIKVCSDVITVCYSFDNLVRY